MRTLLLDLQTRSVRDNPILDIIPTEHRNDNTGEGRAVIQSILTE